MTTVYWPTYLFAILLVVLILTLELLNRRKKIYVRWGFGLALYDAWVGTYVDGPAATIFICPVPFVVIKIILPDISVLFLFLFAWGLSGIIYLYYVLQLYLAFGG